MATDQTDTEDRNIRVGLILLVLGFLLLLWAWGSWVFRTTAGQQPLLQESAQVGPAT